MAEQSKWQVVFSRWPASIPKRGIVTTTLNENIPFKGFMISGDALLLERTNPDALGARFIMLEYPSVASVKYIDPLKAANFVEMGFEGKMSQ
jgi:hypothetical protein